MLLKLYIPVVVGIFGNPARSSHSDKWKSHLLCLLLLATPTRLNSLQTTVDDDDNVIINLTIDMTTTSSCFVCWLHLLLLLLCMTLSSFIYFLTPFRAISQPTPMRLGKLEKLRIDYKDLISIWLYTVFIRALILYCVLLSWAKHQSWDDNC